MGCFTLLPTKPNIVLKKFKGATAKGLTRDTNENRQTILSSVARLYEKRARRRVNQAVFVFGNVDVHMSYYYCRYGDGHAAHTILPFPPLSPSRRPRPPSDRQRDHSFGQSSPMQTPPDLSCKGTTKRRRSILKQSLSPTSRLWPVSRTSKTESWWACFPVAGRSMQPFIVAPGGHTHIFESRKPYHQKLS